MFKLKKNEYSNCKHMNKIEYFHIQYCFRNFFHVSEMNLICYTHNDLNKHFVDSLKSVNRFHYIFNRVTSKYAEKYFFSHLKPLCTGLSSIVLKINNK